MSDWKCGNLFVLWNGQPVPPWNVASQIWKAIIPLGDNRFEEGLFYIVIGSSSHCGFFRHMYHPSLLMLSKTSIDYSTP